MKRLLAVPMLVIPVLVITMIATADTSVIEQEPTTPIESVTPTVEVVEAPQPLEDVETVEVEQPPVIVEEPKDIRTFRVTAYCACKKCCGKWALKRPLDDNGNPIVYTASGTVATEGRTIAVDPSLIDYGTTVVINGVEYVAEDCGSAIKGHRIDIYMEDHGEALEWGVQMLEGEIVYE